ncbi:hypothetical protein MMIN_06400 [Mycolicibacter minnesotensis]|nr:hypothetical protein MMIN_06400 [Mycolicibacter minnesotensis]
MPFGLRRKRARCALGASVAASSSLAGPGLSCSIGTSYPGERLGAVVERDGTALLVHAGGSVDASNVALWRRLIAEAATATVAPGPLVIDAKALEFMAVCAFAVLVDEAARCRVRGIMLYLVSDQPVVTRVVNAAGLDSELSLAANIDEALGRVPRRDPGPVLGG